MACLCRLYSISVKANLILNVFTIPKLVQEIKYNISSILSSWQSYNNEIHFPYTIQPFVVIVETDFLWGLCGPLHPKRLKINFSKRHINKNEWFYSVSIRLKCFYYLIILTS
jgi:hypothetical protein